MLTPETFGTALRDRRKAAGLTQESLAAALGVSRQLIGALERGRNGTALSVALAAAAELGLDLTLRPRS